MYDLGLKLVPRDYNRRTGNKLTSFCDILIFLYDPYYKIVF